MVSDSGDGPQVETVHGEGGGQQDHSSQDEEQTGFQQRPEGSDVEMQQLCGEEQVAKSSPVVIAAEPEIYEPENKNEGIPCMKPEEEGVLVYGGDVRLEEDADEKRDDGERVADSETLLDSRGKDAQHDDGSAGEKRDARGIGELAGRFSGTGRGVENRETENGEGERVSLNDGDCSREPFVTCGV